MHQFREFSLLLLYATESASLVLSNTARSNALNQGTPNIIQPANLIRPQNRTGPLGWGNYLYCDIGSNLTIDITLGDTALAQPVHELLTLAKEQVHDRAARFGLITPVPHRKKARDLTHIVRAGLTYFIEPAPAFVRGRPGLEWGEFEVATSWLYEHFTTLLKHRECSFVLFRTLSVSTGQEVNLAFGAIRPLDNTTVMKTTLSGATRLPAESVSPGSIDAS